MDTYFNNEENKKNKETIENKEIKKRISCVQIIKYFLKL